MKFMHWCINLSDNVVHVEKILVVTLGDIQLSRHLPQSEAHEQSS